ncbi:MAG: excinuclease ABC subunit UvrA [Cystobacterineae bacterium]|nr:excinuclease ABC subunit UvrA [Cystobacterineae bacterium]
MQKKEYIRIKGAREHNLKNISLDIPKHQLVVFTGVSGSGKSSLAFDTLYAEGQRRYVESLSAYARQFLGQLEKPKYDSIRGLSPSISIEQKAASSNPRSTVGTVTEIYDFLRVLYASLGTQHCPTCQQRVSNQSAQQMADEILKLPAGQKFQLLSPLVQQRKGEFKELLQDALKRGFVRARIDGKLVSLEQKLSLSKKHKHDILLVIDRLIMTEGIRERLMDSVEAALREGKGVLVLVDEKGEGERVFSELNSCHRCGLSFPELSPARFSFNHPLGMCPECNGLGTKPEMDVELIIPNPKLSIREGAIEVWATSMSKGEGWTAELIESLSRAFHIDLDCPWEKLPQKTRALLLEGSQGESFRVKHASFGQWDQTWEGVLPMLMRRFKATGSEAMRQYYMRFFSNKACQACHGERLNPASRSVKLHGMKLSELVRLSIEEAQLFLEKLKLSPHEASIAQELLKEIRHRLGFLCNVGLSYLSLDRSAATLSGGEGQRIRLASQMGSELTGVLYILDEPSIGLHQRDNARLLSTLQQLRDLGNTVLVVEHDEETIRAANHIVDFGPHAGQGGGHIVAEGSLHNIQNHPQSLTGGFLSGRLHIEIPKRRRKPHAQKLQLLGATAHNLKNIDVEFPLGTLIAVTGVSGAGKSTLVSSILLPALMKHLHESQSTIGAHRQLRGLAFLDKVISIDQKPIGRTPRSNPATYTKVFDSIREVLAKTPEARAFGYAPGRFSFNVKGGRCEECHGDGVKRVEMHFLADVFVPCEVCSGKRFNDATLRVKYKGKNVSEMLEMTVREAAGFFGLHREIARILQTLEDVGLSYLKLGQPSPTLSGGEAQRVKLSRELAKVATGKTLYILDEPTTGLHFDDIQKLLSVLNRLVEAQNTVLVIEHNLDVIKCADWIVDLGPEGGDKGGYLVAQGAPEEIIKVEKSYTGQYLKPLLSAARV